MSWYFIEPSDVLFFRDAKPFGAGDDHLAVSIFPPNPRTVAGAFRSFILGSTDVDWGDFKTGASEAKAVQEIIGSPTGFAESAFSMRGPFFSHRSSTGRCDLLCPLPLDAFILDEKEEYSIFRSFEPLRSASFSANWPEETKLCPLWPSGGERKDTPKELYWFRDQAIQDYKQGGAFSGILQDTFVDYEPRVGNALDLSVRVVKESLLYQATFVRMKENYGLTVWLEDALDVSLPEEGYLSLGGEYKAAFFKRMSNNDVPFAFGLSDASRKIKVVLMTPAYFDDPVKQDWSEILGFSATLRAAALGKPLHLGGYDVARGQQRAIYAYVPPGSVFFFETEEPVSQLTKPFTKTVTPEMPLDRLGYGQAFLGTWDWQTIEEDK